MIHALKGEFPIVTLCEVLGVSTSGYYAASKRLPSAHAEADKEMAVQIRRIHAAHRGRYGSPRVRAELKDRGVRCGRRRVARLMRREGLRGVRKRAFRPKTTLSNHDQPIAPNRLPTTPCTQPDQVWLGDITYIPTREGWLYLAGILDGYSRKLKGWKLDENMKSSLTLEALEQAVTRAGRRPKLNHTDQGVQYASKEYRDHLALWHIEPSMSRRGNCYDNAMMESFWATLKTELFGSYVPVSRAEARSMIFEYIEVYYNRRRKHSALGYMSPVDFEAKLAYE